MECHHDMRFDFLVSLLIFIGHLEVVQQSKARKKDEFLHAFTPVVVDACAVAYRGATNDIQHKLKRVIEVWRDRQIFDESVQQAIEERVRGK